jgi:hypothetical protein
MISTQVEIAEVLRRVERAVDKLEQRSGHMETILRQVYPLLGEGPWKKAIGKVLGRGKDGKFVRVDR